jgi:23S rRNA (guanosine2251-2'-O)-methyltransferase
MPGNSKRRGAMRKDGTKKGAVVGSGGQRRAALQGKGPTPKAVDRPHHPAARRARRRPTGDSPSTARRRTAGSVLMGRNPVVEALRAGIPASALYVQSRVDADDRWREALRLAVAASIPVLEVTKPELDRLTDGGVHQGMALTMPEHKYADLDDVLGASLLVVLDGVTDPRNLGAIARSAAAFGAGGIVVPTRRSVGVTASAWKASAGALARVPVARVSNVTRALEVAQKTGFTVVGLTGDSETAIGDLAADVLTDPIVIVIGSEGEGLSRLVGQTCDWRVRIPMMAGTESLNAAVAAGIALQTVFSART